VQIHGLAEKGILAGRLSDWTLERVKIIANGNAGFDGDLGEPSSNSGDLIFRNVEIAWNGCSQAYPAKTVTLNTCWGQQAGGYGDGLGTARTGGRWVFENSRIHHNTSDGLDLLYLDETGSVEVRGLIAEGNAGNQLKFSGAAQVENSVLVSNCAYFEGQPLMLEGDHCRAFGNTLSIELFRGALVTVTNTTITGQGDCLMVIECNAGGCDGTERVKVRNTLFAGDMDWGQPWQNTCLYWHDEQALPVNPLDLDWNLVWRAKDDPCPGAHDVCGQDPLLKDVSLSRFDGRLMAGSPAIDRGTSTGAPARDIQGVLRDDPPDIGAYEFGEQEEAVSSLITHYYQAILGRAPEAAGLTYWTDETMRAQALGIDIQEAFRVMAGQFFTSSEYLGRNASDSQYVADLYRTFFNRDTDAEGLGFWVAQLNAGLPRSVVMFAFLFSDEFAAYMQGLFGVTASRGEISAVVDFYRGFLNRLPDDSGFTYWLTQFRQAQCLNAAAVAAQAEDISRQFLASAEYTDRQRNHRDLIADFYSAFLRRGGEWEGFNFWVGQLDSGTLTVDQVRKAFIASPEFQARLMQIINEGCLL
jgi:hypothetical protein